MASLREMDGGWLKKKALIRTLITGCLIGMAMFD